jgi:hypothetical protein
LAIKDYQYILERSPNDKVINQSLKDCRAKLEHANKDKPTAKEEKPSGFRRVAIAESDSDEENNNKENESVATKT